MYWQNVGIIVRLCSVFSYVFPSMDELSNQLDHVLRYFNLASVVGLGVGAGGNILSRFAYRQPSKVRTHPTHPGKKISLSFLFYRYRHNYCEYPSFTSAGRSDVPDQRGVHAGRLDRVRLSEVERQISQVQRDDTGRDGLLDVASFRKSQYIIQRARVMSPADS